MKISCVSLEELWARTPEEKFEIVCGGICDDGATAKVALLLGTKPAGAIHRAKAAADLYRAGRVEYIVASGGVFWEHEGENLTEAELMARVLRENGVPAEAIILDNEARTTKENMICGTLQINRALTFGEIDRVIIVTSLSHMKRSMGLAKAYLPRKVTPYAYPAALPCSKEEWLANEENVKALDTSIRLTQRLVLQNFMEDFEV